MAHNTPAEISTEHAPGSSQPTRPGGRGRGIIRSSMTSSSGSWAVGHGRGRMVDTDTDREQGYRDMVEQMDRLREEMEQLRSQPQPKISVVMPKQKKVRKFCGDGSLDGEYTVEEFVEEMRGMLRGEEDPEERVQIVMSHIEGMARTEVRTCGRPRTSVEEIFEILKDAFGDRRSLPVLLTEFTERKQNPRESVRTYANDLYARFSKLQKKQRASKSTVSDEDLLIGHFCEGLRDRGLVLDLKRQLKHGSSTFAEIREAALEWEEVRGGPIACRTAGVESVSELDGATRIEKQQREILAQNEYLQSALRKQEEKFMVENQRLRREIEALKTETKAGRLEGLAGRESIDHRKMTQGFGRGQDQSSRKGGRPVCFRCGLSGHVQRFCNRPAPGRQDLNGNPSA